MTDNNSMEYFPVTVARVDWSEDQNAVLVQRRLLLPELEHEHAYDASSQHYFATLKNNLVGYLCIDPDGHISFAATQNDHQGEIADALLRFAVLDTPRRGLALLSAPVAHPWKDSLEKIGFSTVQSHSDNILKLFLPPDRSFIASGSSLVRLEQVDAFKDFAVQLVRDARYSVIIFSEDLEAWLYDNDAFTDAILELLQRTRNSSVRLLVRDTKSLLERGHRLLRASHRATEKIQIRKLPAMLSEKYPNYMITDDNGLLYRQDPQVINGIGYTDYRARVKPLLEEYKLLWSRSTSDPDLRAHTL